MANRDLFSTCHPERKRHVGERCTACYMRDRRASAHVNDKVIEIDTLASNRDFIAQVNEIIDKRLIYLNIWNGIIEGNGERAREIWAEALQKSDQNLSHLPTGLTIDFKDLRGK